MDTDPNVCGWCGKPLDPAGDSLYFCTPGRNKQSECQAHWFEALVSDPEAHRPSPAERAAGFVAANIE